MHIDTINKMFREATQVRFALYHQPLQPFAELVLNWGGLEVSESMEPIMMQQRREPNRLPVKELAEVANTAMLKLAKKMIADHEAQKESENF